MFSFIQADGSFSSVTTSSAFWVYNVQTATRIASQAVGMADGHRAQREKLISLLSDRPFRLGQLLSSIELDRIPIQISREEFVDEVVAYAQESL